jgi:hypothetical protein
MMFDDIGRQRGPLAYYRYESDSFYRNILLLTLDRDRSEFRRFPQLSLWGYEPVVPVQTHDPALLGNWVHLAGITERELLDIIQWLDLEDGDLYIITFNDDGTGSRGTRVMGLTPDRFSWNVVSAGRVVLNMELDGGMSVPLAWDYRVNGNILTMNSVDVPGLDWTFVRR